MATGITVALHRRRYAYACVPPVQFRRNLAPLLVALKLYRPIDYYLQFASRHRPSLGVQRSPMYLGIGGFCVAKGREPPMAAQA